MQPHEFFWFGTHPCIATIVSLFLLWCLWDYGSTWILIPCLLLNCIANNYFKFHSLIHVLLNINFNYTFSSMLCMRLSSFSSSCFLVILFWTLVVLETDKPPTPTWCLLFSSSSCFFGTWSPTSPPLQHLICLNVRLFVIYN